MGRPGLAKLKARGARPLRAPFLGLFLVTVPLAACDSPDLDPTEATPRGKNSQVATSEDTLGLAEHVGLDPEWVEIGSLEPGDDIDKWTVSYLPDAESSFLGDDGGDGLAQWVAVHVPSRTVFLVTVDAAKLKELSALAAEVGLDAPSHDSTGEFPTAFAEFAVGGDFGEPSGALTAESGDQPTAQGGRAAAAELRGPSRHSASWSDGVDTRTRRAIADGPTATHWPFRTIGRQGNCTGGLVGPRHVLTAAHCVTTPGSIYSGSASVATPAFSPRRDFTLSPWGTHNPIWVWWPASWGSCQSNCNEWDIALMVLDDWTIGHSSGHPGWMGYSSNLGTGWQTGSNKMWMRGYPVFSANNAAPATMVSAGALWGDTQRCNIGTAFSPDSAGDDREATFDCDGSDGQSGSPIYRKTPSTLTRGVFSGANACQNAACSGMTFVNTMTILTPAYASWVNWFKDQCPTTTSSCSF